MSASTPSRHPGINLGRADPEAHREAEETIFGFWVFLMSDLVLFALLFAVYATMIGATDGGPSARDLFDLRSVLFQTGVLLASSVTVGMVTMGVKYDGTPLRTALWLAATLALGVLFLGLELRDMATMVEEGAGPSRSGWLSSLWALISAHGLHVAAGCFWALVMLVQIAVFGMSRAVKLRLLRLGLFWHLLDVVWIGIFTVVYLGGLA